ncbi:hypothetical protein AC630_09145 [Bradyrhizobium sp. AS23.2]|nr:hypothetical protein AC630_09145 [Bradyrhizobium sp. AS23.2]
MQIRPKTYLHFISMWRSLRDAIPPHDEAAPAKASRSLIYTSVVLALLLTILEIDAHRSELQSLGLMGSGYPIQAVFLSP